MKNLTTIAAVLAFAGTATADDKAAKKAPEAKKPDAPQMEMPKPSAELSAMAKDMVGTWKCSGKAMDPTGAPMEFKNLSIKQTLDLDKFWIRGEMTGQIGPVKVRSVDYMSYDATQKKWFRLAVDNHGGQETNWSSDGKTWEGEQRMMGTAVKVKATMDVVKPGKEWKLAAQMSSDGKKWAPGFEMACKK